MTGNLLPTFAVAYTVKNEAKLLPHAVEFYLAAGCSKIYIFWDGTTDDGPQRIIHSSDRIVSFPSVRPEELQHTPEWIACITPRWNENMDVRKRINTFFAARLAASEGIQWLVCIDPDEIVLPSLTEPFHEVSIANFLAAVPCKVDQIFLRNLEVVPTRTNTSNPFTDCTEFLNRFPKTELTWRASRAVLRHLVKSPELRAWYDHYFYRIRFRGAFPRPMRHPTKDARIPRGYYLGYSNFKSIVRTSRAAMFHFDIHKWRAAEALPQNMVSGFLLHYDFFDARHLITKFRQRPNTNRFNADFPRNTIAQIVMDNRDEDIERFFEENIVISDDSELMRLRRQRILLKIDHIAEFAKRLGIMTEAK